jgi:tetratricopeptide (TPR) repeat protein
MKTITTVVCALLIYCLTGCYSVEQSTLERAYRQYGRRQYDWALMGFDQVLKKNPNNLLALVGRADVFGEKKMYPEAIAGYDQAIRLWQDEQAKLAPGMRPRGEETVGYRPLSYQNQGLKLPYGLGAHLYYHRGVTWYEIAQQKEGRYDGDSLKKALADYNEALVLAPNLVAAYINRGAVYKIMGRLEESLADYEQALRLTPDDEKVKAAYAAVQSKLQTTASP